MTKPRMLTLALIAAAVIAAAPSWAQDINNDAETQDMLFIEQCLQRSVAEKVPENRIDDFIDRCLNDLYEQKEQAGGGTGAAPGNGDDSRLQDGAVVPGDAE